MAYASSARGWSAGKTTIVVVLAVIGVLALVAGIMYLTEPAKSLPSILGAITSPAGRASAHRSTRGYVSVAVAVVCLVGAGLASRSGRKA